MRQADDSRVDEAKAGLGGRRGGAAVEVERALVATKVVECDRVRWDSTVCMGRSTHGQLQGLRSDNPRSGVSVLEPPRACG